MMNSTVQNLHRGEDKDFTAKAQRAQRELKKRIPYCFSLRSSRLRGGNEFGFTMIELMTVITIIVLMLALSIPVVRVLEGNRSLEAGYNTLAAALGHARQIALYYHEPAGLAFYKDSADAQHIAFVTQEMNLPQDVALVSTSFPNALDSRFYDIIPGEEVLTLPLGIAVQLSNGNGANYNNAGIVQNEQFLPCGLVLFDENGELASLPYCVTDAVVVGQYHLGDTSHLDLAKSLIPSVPPPALYSHPAVCLYDQVAYLNQTVPSSGDKFADNNSASANYYGYFASPSPVSGVDKAAEAAWLQTNGEVLVIRPNDGSLLRNK
jgi:type II secretory pathway pseudopilin PulG